MRPERRGLICIVALVAALAVPTGVSCARPVHTRGADSPFYLHDGDRVLFYGDSITEQRLYTGYIESFCRTRFPRWNLSFVNSGWSGDRVTGGGGGPIDLRLERDVLPYKPTVVTICLGMNDGQYKPLDPTILATFVQGYQHIVDTLKKGLPGVRITVLTASAFDDVTRPPNFPGGYNGTLSAMNDAIKELARREGLLVADTNGPLVEALRKAQASYPNFSSTIIPDRVHPSPGGHVIMAAAVLKAWNAPGAVATFHVDAQRGRVTGMNTQISDVQASSRSISFAALDRAIPWPIDRDQVGSRDMEIALAVTDIEDTLNRYTFRATGLSMESYTLKIDGHPFGPFSRTDLEKGVDLATLKFLGTYIQSRNALIIVRDHNNIHYKRWRTLQVPNTKNGAAPPPEIQQQMDALDGQERDELTKLADTIVPKPHTFALAPQ